MMVSGRTTVSDVANRAAMMFDGDEGRAKWFVRALSIDLQKIGVRYKHDMALEDQFEDTMKVAFLAPSLRLTGVECTWFSVLK